MAKSGKQTDKSNRFNMELLLSFMRYFIIGLAVAYLYYYVNLPELAQTLTSSLCAHKQPEHGIEQFFHGNQSADIFKPEDWNDLAFMSSYSCNPSHTYSVQIVKKDPVIMYITGFLAPGEAEHLKFISHPMMNRSKVVGKDDSIFDDARTSSNAFLHRGHDEVVSCIEYRAAQFSQKPFENMEDLQVVYYGKGQEYQPHCDYFEPGREGTDRALEHGGQREITFFVYLNTLKESEGGDTIFPHLELAIKPEKNNAAFWYDMNDNQEVDPRTYHGGAPVELEGREKWGLNIWIREREFK